MKKIIVCLLFTIAGFAQQDHIWYFGNRAGLDFNSDTPQLLTNSQMSTDEGCATVSDLSGHLLFYTNGVTIWNRSHQIMQNGTGLQGDVYSSQSAIVVQKPGQYHIYYVFTAAAATGPAGISYSEVDMTAGNGFGAVTVKNIPLVTPACEKLTATMHANGQDVWVMAHGWLNNTFYSYRITAQGVTAAPVVSSSGDVIEQGDGNMPPYKGCMKLSRNGTRLAVANYGQSLQLFDFNNQTGTVANPVTMASDSFASFYGVEFSPSGNALYVAMLYRLRQYDLEAADPTNAIKDWIGAESQYGALQMGPDNKIYSANHYVGVVNNPDIIGNGCNYDMVGIDVGANDGRSARMSLPSFITLPNALDIAFSGNCTDSNIAFSLQSSLPQDTASWDFGDGTTATGSEAEHAFAQPGTYIVTLTASRQGISGEMKKTIIVSPGPAIGQPQDMRSCDDGNGTAVFNLASQDAAVLNGQDPAAYTVTYYLSAEDAAIAENALPAEYTSTASPQTVYARLAPNAPGGCYATADFQLEIVKPEIVMPDRYSLCEGGSVLLTAPDGFAGYAWSNGETTRSVEITQVGTYTLTVYQDTGDMLCSAEKQITVIQALPPVIARIETDDWHTSQNSITVLPSGEGDFEYSTDGVNFQQGNTFENLAPGYYTVYMRNACGMVSKEVALLMYPNYFTPNGDGENDSWQVKYAFFEPDISVNIFDRYGKVVASFNGASFGWDGKFNGHDLPSTDYWFVVQRRDGTEHRGHFAMIR